MGNSAHPRGDETMVATAITKKVLVVEDDEDILKLVKMYLDNEGFKTITALNGADALQKVKSEHPDLLVLDLMLPEIDGLEVCKKLRLAPETAVLPIIILTAKSEESETVAGFELGADDYVAKPFSPRALVARIKALFRRLERHPDYREVSAYQYGMLLLDPSSHEVTVNGQEVLLTA
jgi:DNA-binding response OmpR family regulator